MSHLIKIGGVVQSLRVEKGYQDLLFGQPDKQAAGLAAVGAAAMGQVASATVLGNASAGSEVGMDFFSCTVEGEELHGAFHRVEFQNGEDIEFVAEPDGQRFAVQAARNPTTRMLWMQPHQVRGHVAQKWCDIRWSIQWPLVGVALVAAAEYFRDKDFGTYGWRSDLGFYSLVFFITLVITVWIRLRFKGFSRQATEVFRTFGYKRPELVDAWVQHKQAQKELAAKTNTLPPLVTPWSYRY
jgi:hypothetical protein